MTTSKDLQKAVEAEVKTMAEAAAKQYRGWAPVLRAATAGGMIHTTPSLMEIALAAGSVQSQDWLTSKEGRVYSALRAFVAERVRSRCPDDGLGCRLEFAWSFDQHLGAALPCGEGCSFDVPQQGGMFDGVGEMLHGAWDKLKGLVGMGGGACCASCAKGGPCESDDKQKASAMLGPSSDLQRISGQIPPSTTERRTELLRQYEELRWKCTTLSIADTVVSWGPVGFLAQAYEALSGNDLAQATLYCQQADQIQAELAALGQQGAEQPSGADDAGKASTGFAASLKDALAGITDTLGLTDSGDDGKPSTTWYERAIGMFFEHIAWSVAITVIVGLVALAVAVTVVGQTAQGGQMLVREALPLAPDLLKALTPQGRALAMAGMV